MRYKILPIMISALLIGFTLLSTNIAGETIIENKPAPAKICELIKDTTTLKLILVDLKYNLLGLAWEDRDKYGIGREKLIEAAEKITSKYKIELAKIGFLPLVTNMGGEFKGSEHTGIVFIYAPEILISEVVHLRDEHEKLPIVKLRAGKITLSLKSMSVSFTDKTVCVLKGKEYVFYKGKWFQK